MFCAIAAHKIAAGRRLERSSEARKQKKKKGKLFCKTMTTAIKIAGPSRRVFTVLLRKQISTLELVGNFSKNNQR